MSRIFKGRAVLPGKTEGEALISHQGFNTLASFYHAILTNADKAVCSDQDNVYLYGKNLTDKILCLPKTIGSTSAGAVWEKIAEMGIAPRALLFSGNIDSLAAAGVFLTAVWVGKRVITMDRLGSEFLKYVKEGQKIEIKEDGRVVVL